MSKRTDRDRDAILKAAGYDDIESRTGELRSLPGPAHVRGEDRGLTPEYYEGTAEYYQQAGAFLHSHRFTSSDERDMWALHVEGIGYREIATRCSTHAKRVNQIVARLRAKMLTSYTRSTRSPAKRIYREVARMDWQLLLMLAPALLGGK